MPADPETLFDTATQPEAVVDPPVKTEPTEKPATDPAPTVQATADKEAAEIGKILLDSGFSKDQLNDLMAAPSALNAIRSMVTNDPQEFLKMLERTDPDSAKNFHEKLADLYVERYADKNPPATSGAGKQGDSELMREVQALKSETNALRTERERERLAASMAQVQNRYNSRVDDLLGTKEVKDLGLTKSEQKAIRAQLNAELANDPNAVKRVSNGNFVDVPMTFKGIIESWAADKKAASETAKGQRDRTSNSAFPEFPSGPNSFMVDVPANVADSWDNAEEGLGAALNKLAR